MGTQIVPRVVILLVFLFSFACVSLCYEETLVKVSDEKSYKKLLKSRSNIFLSFAETESAIRPYFNVLKSAAKTLTGSGAVAYVDCSEKDTKKICKGVTVKFRGANKVHSVHVGGGAVDAEYNRAMTEKSIVNFMKNPTADPAWDEDESAKHVLHLDDKSFNAWQKKKESGVVMFYAPWCGHCKKLKPEYATAATLAKAKKMKMAFAAVDADTSRATGMKFNVTSYPTLKYFEKGAYKFDCAERTADTLVNWASHPTPPPPPPPPEVPWSEQPDTAVLHLTDTDFDSHLQSVDRALVMFFAPWCGHCKAAKPAFESAAALVANDDTLRGVAALAAVDATAQKALGARFNVSGFPTFVYLEHGEERYHYDGGRTTEDFITFLRAPAQDFKAAPSQPSAEAGWSADLPAALHLNTKNFDSELAKYQHALVFFYAPWCTYCKKFKPNYQALASYFSSEYSSSVFAAAAVNGDAESALTQRFQIELFPTLHYFAKGKFVETYSGERTEEQIKLYIQQKVQGPPASHDEL